MHEKNFILIIEQYDRNVYFWTTWCKCNCYHYVGNYVNMHICNAYSHNFQSMATS